jgi:anti-sigma factor RsiW
MAEVSQSGGELLAAARAARCKHLAAADRRRAGAKAVTTLAHELAGLISPLHGLLSGFQSSAEKIERRPTLHAQTPTRRYGGFNQAASRKNERGAHAPL